MAAQGIVDPSERVRIPLATPVFLIFYPAYTIEPSTFGTVPETTNPCGFFFLSVEYLLWLKTLALGAF